MNVPLASGAPSDVKRAWPKSRKHRGNSHGATGGGGVSSGAPCAQDSGAARQGMEMADTQLLVDI